MNARFLGVLIETKPEILSIRCNGLASVCGIAKTDRFSTDLIFWADGPLAGIVSSALPL